jgi:hypothetical protein
VNDHQSGAALVVVAPALGDEPGTLTKDTITHVNHRATQQQVCFLGGAW